MILNHHFEENENPNTKIAFVVWTPFHFYVYKNIAKHLPQAEFVVCDTWYASILERGSKHVLETITLLKRESQYWRVLTTLTDGVAAEKFFQKYEVIASVLLWPPLESLDFDDWFSKKKSVLINYGAGKDLNTFAPWVAQFDLSLVDGPYIHAKHKLFTESHIVGVPKYDDWFSGSLDGDAIKSVRKRLDPSKKNVLYLPTHSGLSSLYDFADEVQGLKDGYNVLIKFHNHNRLTEAQIVKNLEQDKSLFLFDGRDDLLTLFALADVVISDSSSVMLEAVLVGKPLIILDVTADKERMERHMQGDEFNDYWYSGGITHLGSIEERAKKQDPPVGIVFKKGDDIRAAVRQAADHYDHLKEGQEVLRNKLFSYDDGKCGERAADIIRNFLKRDKSIPPVLGLAARNYFLRRFKNYKMSMQKRKKMLHESGTTIRYLKKELAYYIKQDEMYRSIKEEKSIIRKIRLLLKTFFV